EGSGDEGRQVEDRQPVERARRHGADRRSSAEWSRSIMGGARLLRTAPDRGGRRSGNTARGGRAQPPPGVRRRTTPAAATKVLYHRSAMAIFTDRTERAIAAAVEAHQGQTRKGDHQLPYIVHPVTV